MMRNCFFNEKCTNQADACTSASFSRALLVLVTNVILSAFVFLCHLLRIELVLLLIAGVIICIVKYSRVNTDFKEFMQTA